MKMNKLLALSVLALSCNPALAETFILDGRTLDVETLWEASKPGNDVKVSSEGWQRIKDSYQTTIDAAKSGMEIYGLTTNFGDLKDEKVVGADIESEEARRKSVEFNIRQLRIQAGGVQPFIPDHLSKMSMIIRLNQMAAGYTGMTPETAGYYLKFINNDVYPLIPGKGSPGVNDLSWPTHIGLAMIGEWDVHYKGKKVASAEVLDELDMKPLEPFGLDGISILSNGNVSMAITIDTIMKVEKLLDLSPALVVAGLETLNGNMSPFLWHSVEAKGMPMGHHVAEKIINASKGSYLWEPHKQRYLQDPLSFRGSHWSLATAYEELEQLKQLVNRQINHSSDNPMVTIDAPKDKWYYNTSYVKALEANQKGYVNSNSAFDFTQIAVQVESLTTAFAHVIHNSGWRILQVGDSHRTGLKKYLVSEKNVGGDGFANILQPVSGLYAEAMALTNNVTIYGLPTSITIEETFSNVSVTADRLTRMSELATQVFSFELLHMLQGAEIRKEEQGLELADTTERLLNMYRERVPFVDKDRIYTHDVQNGIEFINELDVDSIY